MKLKVIGSTSKGNCYILTNNTEALIIECGMSFQTVKVALGFNIMQIVGVICSHGHQDHFNYRYIPKVKKAGIDIWKSWKDKPTVKKFGGFTVQSFSVPHDVECRGFLIKHNSFGKLLFVTDASYCPYVFKDLDYIMVEANHDKNVIDVYSLGRHEHKSIQTHMDISTTVGLLKANDNPNLKGVVLLHLSKTHADPENFKQQAESVVDCPVYIAKRGLEVRLDG